MLRFGACGPRAPRLATVEVLGVHAMLSRLRPSAAAVIAVLALLMSMAGTAEATLLITKNSQVGGNTISGHNPPSGFHANLVSGSVGATDLHSGAVTSAKLGANAVTSGKIGTARS